MDAEGFLTPDGPTGHALADQQTAESLLGLLGETAVQGASLYAAHSGRLAATAEDVKRALMLEVLVYAKRPGILERVRAVHRELSSSRRDLGAPCSGGCALCRWFNTIYQEWARWGPQTPIELELKTHIGGGFEFLIR